MVATKASANANKRKKTADMPDSPPKRVTRSRAKGMEVPEPEPIKTTKIKTASAKAVMAKPALRTKGNEKPATVTKRTTRANDSAAPGVTDQPMLDVTQQDEQVQAKTRGRRKKPIEQEEKPVETAPASKTRSQVEQPDLGGVIETGPAGKVKAPATRATRATASTLSKAEKEKPAAKVTKKSTRGTTVSGTIGKTSTPSIAKAPIPRKKVTFQETSEQDKENQPAPEPKRSGINAKPIRKPVAVKPATRKGKVASVKEAEKEASVEQLKPLSPKKIIQVAKSFSSEDELAAGKTPIKLLNQSPRRPPTSILKETDSATLNSALSASPTRAPIASSLMGSPPRRPPPSPFKGTINDSPKKLDFGSPKKFIFGASTVSTSLPQQSNFKASLLQSSAKRPASPTRIFAPSSPSKTFTASESEERALDTIRRSPLKVTRFTPHKISSTPLRATQSSTWSVPSQTTHLSPAIVEDEGRPEEKETEVVVTESCNINEESTTPPGSPQWATLGAQSVFGSPIGRSPVTQGAAPESIDTLQLQIEQADEVSTSVDDVFNKEATPSATPFKCSTQSRKEKNLPSAFRLNFDDQRLQAEESDSEDELQSTFKPGSLQSYPHEITGTPTPAAFPRKPRSTLGRSSFHTTMTSANGNLSLTPLATQLSSWLAASPDKKAPRISQGGARNVFSPVGLKLFGQMPQASQVMQQASPQKSVSPLKSSFFEEEMMILDQDEPVVDVHEDEQGFEESAMIIQAPGDSFESNTSAGSNQYADENALPIDPQLFQVEAEGKGEVPLIVETCTPARVFYSNPREIHTVSKVPLQPPADDTPNPFPRKRSQSLSSPFKSRGVFMDLTGQSLSVKAIDSPRNSERTVQEETDVDCMSTPVKLEGVSATDIPLPITPSGGTWSAFTTPGRSARKGADAQILRGAVVYVDVHTTEGADASAIFVELLTSMGARCVKQWNWNPRASLGSSLDTATDGQDPASGTPSSKVGITHVVFKDGGKRTLEKVRESNGLVSCVGVGWVLE